MSISTMSMSPMQFIDRLGDQMKKVEVEYNGKIVLPHQWMVVRLHGHKFSKYATKFPNKPFDNRFSEVMIKTMLSLMKYHLGHPILGHCHSDEITLVYSPLQKQGISLSAIPEFSPHPFNGRVVKIASLLAGQCSSVFYMNMLEVCEASPELSKIFGELTPPPSFDAQVLAFDTPDQVLDHAIWRASMDCWRNFVCTLGRHIHGSKAVFKKNTKQILEMIESHDRFAASPKHLHLKNGTFARNVKKETVVSVPGRPDTVSRRKELELRCISIPANAMNSDERQHYVNFLLSRDGLWPSQ